MTPEQIEQIIDTLAEKLGPIGAEVWSIYVRQVYVDVAVGLLLALAFGIGLAVCGWGLRRAGTIKDSFDREFAKMGSVFGMVVFSALMGCALVFGVTKVLNPEYYAIQMLLGR